MPKYAVRVTVADVRDGYYRAARRRRRRGGGNIDLTEGQMVFAEVTLAVPLLVGYAYHPGYWKARAGPGCVRLLDPVRAA